MNDGIANVLQEGRLEIERTLRALNIPDSSLPDLVQETTFQLLKVREEIRKPLALAKKIAHNRAMDWHRRNRRYVAFSDLLVESAYDWKEKLIGEGSELPGYLGTMSGAGDDLAAGMPEATEWVIDCFIGELNPLERDIMEWSLGRIQSREELRKRHTVGNSRLTRLKSDLDLRFKRFVLHHFSSMEDLIAHWRNAGFLK